MQTKRRVVSIEQDNRVVQINQRQTAEGKKYYEVTINDFVVYVALNYLAASNVMDSIVCTPN